MRITQKNKHRKLDELDKMYTVRILYRVMGDSDATNIWCKVVASPYKSTVAFFVRFILKSKKK
jgi:hypothetical protein